VRVLRFVSRFLLTALPATIGSVSAEPRTVLETASILTLSPNVETSFPIRVTAGDDMPKRAMLLIKGIPRTASLTEGRVFDSGIWFIPAAQLPTLKIVAASESAGLRSRLTLTLVAPDGTMVAEGQSTMVVAAAGSPQAAAPVSNAPDKRGSAAGSQPDGPRPPAETPDLATTTSAPPLQPPEEAERLRAGQSALALNDIAAARLIFQYLADRGSAAGAWHLAQTYDPQVLARTVGARFRPDAANAAKWYEKAAELGHPEARRKIAGGR
jgi:hypothetical protein